MNRFDRSTGDIPVYIQISNSLTAEIQQNYKPGDRMPSENELAKRFKVNRHTLRRAIEVLVTKGMVGKLQGKGIIVQQKVINYPIHRETRFTETLENSGRQAESIVLRKMGIAAHGEVATSLNVEEGEPVILVETLRKMDGAPFSVTSHYFPFHKAYDVLRKYAGGSLHSFFSQHYGIRLKRTLSLISAILPDQSDMKTLEISGNSPVLQVKSVNMDLHSQEPVEFVVSRFKGISTQLSVEPV